MIQCTKYDFGSMAEITKLQNAVRKLVHNGSAAAMEGFTHLIPFAAGHEVIRQQLRDLTLIRMTPDLIYDQLIGMGCAARLIFSWGGNPGVGSLHRFRDAVENDWPRRLEIEEHSHADMAARYQAGSSGLPFAVMRGYLGSDLPKYNRNIHSLTCPFTGEVLVATPALRPDVTILHAQKAVKCRRTDPGEDCSRATRATDAPGCIASSTILRFSAMLRRCRLGCSIFTTAELSITTSSITTLRVMISLN
jgi:acyl CoA:acetate/3-ketoacid CoA transferase alpha subunit